MRKGVLDNLRWMYMMLLSEVNVTTSFRYHMYFLKLLLLVLLVQIYMLNILTNILVQELEAIARQMQIKDKSDIIQTWFDASITTHPR